MESIRNILGDVKANELEKIAEKMAYNTPHYFRAKRDAIRYKRQKVKTTGRRYKILQGVYTSVTAPGYFSYKVFLAN